MKELKVLQQQQILGKPLTLYGDFENPLFLCNVAVRMAKKEGGKNIKKAWNVGIARDCEKKQKKLPFFMDEEKRENRSERRKLKK